MRSLRRLGIAGATGAGVALLLATVLALFGDPTGAGDNNDGVRMFCGAGIAPATTDGQASWKGGVVLDFIAGHQACDDPAPSSALVLLQIATRGDGPWSLTGLGWLYVGLVALVASVSTWAVSVGRGGGRWLVLVPVIGPLADPEFSRFFVSTYAEPAGLLGAVTMLSGIAALTVTDRKHVPERAVGLSLTTAGALTAATAKPAYLPLLLIGVAVLVIAAPAHRRWSGRMVGSIAALVVLAAAAGPVAAAVTWQSRTYADVNAHNVVFTMLLPTAGEPAAAAVGLPESVNRHAGRGYYPLGPDGIAGWARVGEDPMGVRLDAYKVLIQNPANLAEVMGTALRATQDVSLRYLPSAPLTAETVAPPPGSAVGEQGASGPELQAWLQRLPVPWWPGLVLLTALVVGGASLRTSAGRHRTHMTISSGPPFFQLAGAAALGAVGLLAAAVLGDGYFELAKHVWLAAYTIDVAEIACLIGCGAAIYNSATRLVRGHRGSSPPGHDTPVRQ